VSGVYTAADRNVNIITGVVATPQCLHPPDVGNVGTQPRTANVLFSGGGVLAKGIFWQVAGACDKRIAHMEGVLLVKTAVTFIY
jgi:hypothetical protein